MHFEVDSTPRTSSGARDSKAALAKAKAAADYSLWLKAEIQQALDDHQPAFVHDQAMAQIRAGIKMGAR